MPLICRATAIKPDARFFAANQPESQSHGQAPAPYQCTRSSRYDAVSCARGVDAATAIPLACWGAAAWPVMARAQQPERMRRVGILMGSADNAEFRPRVTLFTQALAQLNWT